MHYIDLYLVYHTPVSYIKSGDTKSELEHHTKLLALSQIAQKIGEDNNKRNEADDEVDRETADFDARTHIQFF